MQRVSGLLPLWERVKPADSAGDSTTSSSASATASTSASASATTTAAAAGKTSRPTRKVFSWADRIGVGRNLTVSPATANAGSTRPASIAAPGRRMGREAYWPTTLDHECEKAARILKSFCTDGFLDESADSTPTSPRSRTSITSLSSPRFPPRRPPSEVPQTSPTTSAAGVKKKIPPRVVQEAVGLAIFSCMRSGLWMSGSGGSGILIARKADGTWSPPSGIMLHTSTLAFVIGVDIYDCVLVINSVAALEMFTRPRLTLGTDVPLTVGPLTSVGLLENDFRWNNEMGNTVLTYLKARGRYRPAQLHGSLVTERSNENERFYSEDSTSGGTEPIDVLDILAGNIRKLVPEIVPLFEAIKAAEGRVDFDSATMDRLSLQPAPGDADIFDTPALLSPTSPKSSNFGLPDAADPDPFGIIALEMAGLEIREAGSKHRPSSNQFDYAASPTSPVFATRFSRQSADGAYEYGNRTSYMSTRTQATSMNDACTQTDVAETPDTSLSPTHSDDGKDAETAATHGATSPLPETALPVTATAPVLPNANKRVSAASIPADGGIVRPTSRVFLAVDAGVDAQEQTGAGDDTATSGYYVSDDRDADADDEDEETDGFGDCDETIISGVDGAENGAGDDGEDSEDDDDDDDEEPVIFEVATTAARPVRAMPIQGAQIIQAKGSLVTIAKRIPPPLPPRSPARRSRASKGDFGDLPASSSPYRQSFQSTLSAQSAQSAQSGHASATSTEQTEADKAEEERTKPSAETAAPEPAVSTEAASVVIVTETASCENVLPTPSPSSTVCEPSAALAAIGERNENTLESSPMSRTAEFTASSVDDSDREPSTPHLEDQTEVAGYDKESITKPHEQQETEAEMGRASPSTITVV